MLENTAAKANRIEKLNKFQVLEKFIFYFEYDGSEHHCKTFHRKRLNVMFNIHLGERLSGWFGSRVE